MTRYALLASHLMPVVHAATVDTELAPVLAQWHVPIARLCDPLNSQAWVAERVPWADDEQVSQAMAQMDKVVQANAANAEESSAASEELNAQAEQMKEHVYSLILLMNGHDGNGSLAPAAEARPRFRREALLAPASRTKPATAREDDAPKPETWKTGRFLTEVRRPKHEIRPEQIIHPDEEFSVL